MSYNTNVSNECFIIYFTNVYAHASMYKARLSQTTLVTECFITHTNICVDVLSESSVDQMHYYTLHTYKGAHHYVSVDGESDGYVYGMPYYTDHTHKGAHHYVCVYVLADAPFL
jgi:hypothetical protein